MHFRFTIEVLGMIIALCTPNWWVIFTLILRIEINLEFDIVTIRTQNTFWYSIVIVVFDCDCWVQFALEPSVESWNKLLDSQQIISNQPDCSSCLGTMILALATEKNGPSFILVKKWNLFREFRNDWRLLGEDSTLESMFDQNKFYVKLIFDFSHLEW